MEEIYSWIRNIVIYLLINTIIMNLLGNKSYKKYVSIVSGMILVLIVISPLIRLMKLEENLDYFLQANDFAVEASDFKSDLNRMEEAQVDAIFADYKEKIQEQVKDMLLKEKVYIKNFNITFDYDNESTTFGEILRMDITAKLKKEDEEEQVDNLSIDAIEIERIIFGKDDNSQLEELPSPLEIELKTELSDFYNIEPGNININIQGG
ncbi:MAG: putative rane protein [Herbinix sp.]|nr:putative rane protein [Herbinix sp.]